MHSISNIRLSRNTKSSQYLTPSRITRVPAHRKFFLRPKQAKLSSKHFGGMLIDLKNSRWTYKHKFLLVFGRSMTHRHRDTGILNLSLYDHSEHEAFAGITWPLCPNYASFAYPWCHLDCIHYWQNFIREKLQKLFIVSHLSFRAT